MIPTAWGRGALTLLTLLVMTALLVSPALAGNTVTAYGEILSVPAPVAQFSGTPLSGSVPLTVAFDASSSTGTITSYAWDFDNNGVTDYTGTIPTASYTYAAAGTYTVKLTVTGPGGSDNEVKTNYITVTAPVKPVAAFIGTPTSGYAPLTVQFTDQSTNTPTSWKWEYKKGSGSWTQFSTAQNPAYTFTATGTYSIRLTATNAAGSNTLTKSSYITVSTPPKPVAAFTASPTSGLPPLLVQFTDKSTNTPTSWKWEYQKSGTSTWTQFSTAQNPSYTFTATGTYSIRLTATNAGGSNTLTKSNYITVTSPPAPVAAFTATPTSGLVPLAVQFTDQSTNTPTSWKWEYQKSGTSTWTQFSTAQNPSYTFTTLGKYSIRLTATNAGGSNTLTKSNFIQVGQCGVVVASFTGSPTSGPKPLNVQFTDNSYGPIDTWEWDFQNNGVFDSVQRNPLFTYTSKGTYSVKLRVTNTCATSTMIRYSYIKAT